MAGSRGNLELTSGQYSSGMAAKRERHSFRSIRWCTVLESVQWGSVLVMFICTLVPYLIYHRYSTPRERAFLVYDADISHPSYANTVAGWMAPVFPFLLFFVTATFGELVLTRGLHANLTSQLSAWLFLLVDSVLSYWVSLLCTEVLKTHVGVLRPDFLKRCNPDTSVFRNGFVPEIGSTAVPACRSPPSASLEDGHYSFPSGHASASANFEVYLAVYFLWTVFYRRWRRSGEDLEPLMSAGRRGCRAFWHDVGEGFAVLWIIFNLGVTWAISATRITDNKHHVADVVAGMFLGGMIATVFALRAIPRIRGIMEVAGSRGCETGAANHANFPGQGNNPGAVV